MPPKMLRIVKSLQVSVGVLLSHSFEVRNGLRQECTLAHYQTQVCDNTPTEQNRSTQSNLVILFSLPQSGRKTSSVNGLLLRLKACVCIYESVCMYGYVCSQIPWITSIHES